VAHVELLYRTSFVPLTNRAVKSVCFSHLYHLPLEAYNLETYPSANMSDRQPTVFPSGHRGEACWEFSLSGPFDKRVVAVPSVLGWKRHHMVQIYNFRMKQLCSRVLMMLSTAL
jgi:hypothetical protein